MGADMLGRIAIIVGAAALTGCNVQARPISLPDGKQGAALRCRWESKCFEKAEAICPRGYDVLDRAIGWDSWVSMTAVCKQPAGVAE
jgi:hypothetical protein